VSSERHPLAQFALDLLKHKGRKVLEGALEGAADAAVEEVIDVVDAAADVAKERVARAREKQKRRRAGR